MKKSDIIFQNDNLFASKQMSVEKLDFPIEEVEKMVELIINLNREVEKGNFTTNISTTIDILNDALKMLLKPTLIIKEE